MRTLKVGLGSRTYPVHVGSGLLDALGRYAAEAGVGAPGRCAVIADTAVLASLRERVQRSLGAAGLDAAFVPVVGGEAAKTLAEVERVVGALVESRIDRDGTVVALGGGTVGDLAGFVAAVFLRGIRWLHVPTTLLAQVDASVGGKVAVNHPLGKNLVGAFHQPCLVVADPMLCTTLSLRDVWSGLAEVVKTALIADERLFAQLEEQLDALVALRDLDVVAEIVARAVEIKASFVAQDEREAGPRMLLNLGHTLGHAIEQTTGYSHWRHGEAIVLGMTAALHVSLTLGSLTARDATRAAAMLARFPLPKPLPTLAARAVVQAALRDKKARGGRIRFVVLSRIGGATVEDVAEPLLRDALTTAWRSRGGVP